MAREGKLAVFPSLSWFEALQDNVAEDRELAVSGRWSTLNFALQVGEDVFLVRLREGRIEEIIQESGGRESWSFAFVGSPEDWRRFLQESPFYHDLLAMDVRVPTFSIEGDQHVFIQHIRTVKRIFRIAQSLGTCIG